MAKPDGMTVLVIGGAGFIGSRLTKLLVHRGHAVSVLDKQSRPSDVDHLRQYFQADIRNPQELTSALPGFDLVYNLAAEHQDNVRPLSLYFDVNVTGAKNVCEAAKAAGVKRLIFTSSVAVYGAQPHPMNELAEHKYVNEYGRTKHLAEKEFQTWLDSAPDHLLTIVRPTVVFGPGNRGNVYNFLRQIKHGPFFMFGDGANVKSMAYVDNMAAFLAFLADRPERFSVYNYADKPDYSVRALVTFVDQALGRGTALRRSYPVPLAMAAGRVADMVSWIIRRPLPLSAIRVQKFCAPSEIEAAKAFATGFQPPAPMSEGLHDMVVKNV